MRFEGLSLLHIIYIFVRRYLLAITEYCGPAPSAPIYLQEVPGSNPGTA
jgi:hypothetical protein